MRSIYISRVTRLSGICIPSLLFVVTKRGEGFFSMREGESQIFFSAESSFYLSLAARRLIFCFSKNCLGFYLFLYISVELMNCAVKSFSFHEHKTICYLFY